jgi:hypothetical protein
VVGKSTQPEDPLGQDWGRGRRNPQGLYEWYEYPPEVERQIAAPHLGWDEIFGQWPLLEADFASHYHLILVDQLHRPARWLRTHVLGLLSADTRLSRTLLR